VGRSRLSASRVAWVKGLTPWPERSIPVVLAASAIAYLRVSWAPGIPPPPRPPPQQPPQGSRGSKRTREEAGDATSEVDQPSQRHAVLPALGTGLPAVLEEPRL
jgi:hypothetical protein